MGRAAGIVILGVGVVTLAFLANPTRCSHMKVSSGDTIASAEGMSVPVLDGGAQLLPPDKINPEVQVVQTPPAKVISVNLEQKAQTLTKEVAQQDKKLASQKKRIETLDQTVAQIRWKLIEARFDELQVKAEKKKWGTKAPKKDSPDWEAYKEWEFIRDNEAVLREGKRPRLSHSSPASDPIPEPAPPEEFRPSWMSN